MLAMLKWLCSKLMQDEFSQQFVAEKHSQNKERVSSRSSYRPHRLDTCSETLYLMVPEVRKSGYIPFFITERRCSEAALIQIVFGVTEEVKRGVIAKKPMLDEPQETYNLLFIRLNTVV